MFKKLEKNLTGIDYFVGDIHGHYSELMQALNEKNFDFKNDRLIATGDLVDRGKQSKEVLELIEQPWFHSVLGNHDLINKNYIEHRNKFDLDFLYQYGGDWIIKLVQLDNKKAEEYLNLLKTLPYVIEVETTHGTIGVIHGDTMTVDWEIDKNYIFENKFNARDNALWSRKRSNLIDKFPAEQLKDVFNIKNIDFLITGHSPKAYSYGLGNWLCIDTFQYNKKFYILTTEDIVQRLNILNS